MTTSTDWMIPLARVTLLAARRDLCQPGPACARPPPLHTHGDAGAAPGDAAGVLEPREHSIPRPVEWYRSGALWAKRPKARLRPTIRFVADTLPQSRGGQPIGLTLKER